MKRTNSTLRRLAAALCGTLGLVAALPAVAQVNMFDGNWHFSVTPYIWLPNVNGSADFDGPPGAAQRLSTEIGPNNYLSSLKFAFMITGEARKGEWSVFTDYIYLNFDKQETKVRNVTGPRGEPLATINAGSTQDLKGDVWTLAGSYTAWRDKANHLDVLAGFRYLGLDTTLDWNLNGSLGALNRSGSVSQSWDKWDGIVGVKGQIWFGESKWFMPYYADIGTGASNWTWQALAGVGYHFDWGNITLSVRSLSYNFDTKNADVRFTGPALGATFVF